MFTNRFSGMVAALVLGTGMLFIAGCNNSNDDDSSSEKPSSNEKSSSSERASSNTNAHSNDRYVEAGYIEKKKKEDNRLSSDRRFHQRYDRNYADQFESGGQ